MNPNSSARPLEKLRPESQPHGTTEDQSNEMESEGQGGGAAKNPKPKSSYAPHGTTTVSIPRGTVVK